MDKPLNLRSEDCKEEIIKVINSNHLPAFILEPIIKEIYAEITKEKQKEYKESKTKYENAKKEAEINGKHKDK